MNMDMIPTDNQNVYLAAPMWKAATWISMMGTTFKAADKESAVLNSQGPWTARTTNIQRYAHVDIYA
jgi:hypothetical protein